MKAQGWGNWTLKKIFEIIQNINFLKKFFDDVMYFSCCSNSKCFKYSFWILAFLLKIISLHFFKSIDLFQKSGRLADGPDIWNDWIAHSSLKCVDLVELNESEWILVQTFNRVLSEIPRVRELLSIIML